MPTKQHQELRDRLPTPEDRAAADWIYEVTRAPEIATVLWGMAEAIAADHQDWTFWQVVRELKKRVTVITVPAGGQVQ
jgi:hypothetical protein